MAGTRARGMLDTTLPVDNARPPPCGVANGGSFDIAGALLAMLACYRSVHAILLTRPTRWPRGASHLCARWRSCPRWESPCHRDACATAATTTTKQHLCATSTPTKGLWSWLAPHATIGGRWVCVQQTRWHPFCYHANSVSPSPSLPHPRPKRPAVALNALRPSTGRPSPAAQASTRTSRCGRTIASTR